MTKHILTTKEASQYISMSQAFLNQDRMNRTLQGRTPGPSFIRCGKAIRYHIKDLDEWLEKHRVERY